MKTLAAMLLLVCGAFVHANPAATASSRPDLSGVVTSGGKAISRALVYVYTAGPRVGTSPYCPSCYADCRKRATTDKTGAFIIPSLDPQLIFRILVVAEGYEPMFVPYIDPAMGPMKGSTQRWPW